MSMVLLLTNNQSRFSLSELLQIKDNYHNLCTYISIKHAISMRMNQKIVNFSLEHSSIIKYLRKEKFKEIPQSNIKVVDELY